MVDLLHASNLDNVSRCAGGLVWSSLLDRPASYRQFPYPL